MTMELQAAALDTPQPATDGVAAEADLIERARHEPEAFAQLYRLHYTRIATYIHRRTGRRDVTEDLVSNVFLAALRMLPRYRPRPRKSPRPRNAPFRAWLYRIASNEVNQWARRERRRIRRELRHGSVAAESRSATSGGDAVRRALLRLDPKDQDVLVLHHLEGLSVEQIALVHHRPAGTIKSRLHRAREALRQALERKENES